MQWKLKVQNPDANGPPKTQAVRIQADSLTQAIQKAAAWINPDFHGFSLTRVG